MGERLPGLQFSLFGIPVRVELWFFALSLFALQVRDVRGALIWSLGIFVGVLVHELGHAFTMRAYGFPPSITLHALGGWTHFPEGARPTPKQNFFITLAGPGAGLCLGLLALAAESFIRTPNADLALLLSDAVWINITWSFVNLLPILPWDGGLILDSGLQWLTGRRYDRVVALSSMIGGALMIPFALQKHILMLGYFGGMGLFHGYNRWSAALAAAPAVPLRTDDEEKRLQLELDRKSVV